MADTTFVDKQTVIQADWLNDVNDNIYGPTASVGLRADLANTTDPAKGAAMVGYLPAGTGAIGRTVQNKLRDMVSVKDFNAKGDSTTDDTAAIQSALNSLSNGGEVWLPPGTYNFTQLTIPTGVILRGSGEYGSTLRTTSASLTAITLSAASALRDLQIASSVARTGGFFIDVQGNGTFIDAVQLNGYFIGINVGAAGGVMPVNTTIQNCNFINPVLAAGSGAIQGINFANLVMNKITASGPSSGTQPDFGIRLRNGDTAYISDTNITLHGYALYIDTPASQNLYALTCVNSFFDSSGTISGAVTASSAQIIPAGGVYNTKFTSCWFGLSVAQSGCNVAPIGAGIVDGISWSGCEFPDNGDAGLLIVGSAVRNWNVNGGGSGGNTNYGIRAASGTSYFTITGHSAGNYSGRGSNNYGIYVDAAASDFYEICGNNVNGNTTAGILDQGTGTNARVESNNGYNGIGSVSGITVGASPWSYTGGHTAETIYVAGGTVSDISIDSQTVQNTTGSTIQLQPNEMMQITYSVLPTVMRKRN